MLGELPKMKVLFRVDASPQIGGGHVMRCLTLAKVLANEGVECSFVCVEGSQNVVQELVKLQFEQYVLAPEEFDNPDALVGLSVGQFDVLVVDHYGLDEKYEKACRAKAGKIVVLDDLSGRAHDADVLIDPTHGRVASDYSGVVRKGCQLLLGPHYALVRPRFAILRPESLARRGCNVPVRRILVSMGLSDATNATSVVLEAVAVAGLSVAVDVVMGVGSPHLMAVKALAEVMPFPACVHVSPGNMAELMAQADLAVGGGGTASWERCCLGLPTILLSVADNQLMVAKALGAIGAVHYVGRFPGSSVQLIAKALAELVADDKRRQQMTIAASAICDGRGARRVALALMPERARDGNEVTLRPATVDDAENMLAWQQDPRTRRRSRNRMIPTREEHYGWLHAKLSDLNCLFNIIEYAGEPVGVLRLDRMGNRDEYEVSVYVSPDHYRMGLGAAALKLARRLAPEATLVAEVLPGNEASEKLFAGAGYVKRDGLFYSEPLHHLETQSSSAV
ncbi:MAG: UDP-2,4-diacetamido-2,4,6-trideoxy-beta-L-altropyranose hydrolase [Candidatus Melainabacteria bacterium]|nr:UDP-2,4-diacetamido-2,4,6-trideoxy-beta-L-altropyranose hydrolase [Candidatus Melainabacteria bacterium]